VAKADLVVELDKGALSYCIGMQFPQLREIACIGRKCGVSIFEAPLKIFLSASVIGAKKESSVRPI